MIDPSRALDAKASKGLRTARTFLAFAVPGSIALAGLLVMANDFTEGMLWLTLAATAARVEMLDREARL